MAKRDSAYDYIRTIAMLAIVLCHFFQTLGNYAAFSWLNIGVQIFFILSAKLLSQKEVASYAETTAFYKTRLLRIFLPIWIYLLCLVPVLFIVGRGPKLYAIALYLVGMAGFAPSGILGLGHLWYVTVLLILYLLVPVLCCIDRAARKMCFWKGFLLKALWAVAPTLAFAATPQAYFGVNMTLFVAAYFYFRTIGERAAWDRKLAWHLLPFAVVAIGLRLYLDSLAEPSVMLYEIGSTGAKAVLGVFLFALLHWLFSVVGTSRVVRLLSDSSYEVYIVHQFILLALYEFVPLFRNGDFLSRLAFFLAALLLIAGNTAVLYIAKTIIECGLRRIKRCKET